MNEIFLVPLHEHVVAICTFLIIFNNYGKLQCYSSQSCSARKTVGSKCLSENTLDANCTVYIVSRYLCVDMVSCDS